MRRVRVVLLAALMLASVSCSERPSPQATSKSPAGPHLTATEAATVSADPVPPDPRVGAVFLGGQSLHTCTGSVLHSTTGDLILTAAHCLADGIDTSFVPAFAEDAEPQSFWHVDQVYLDPRWVAGQDPVADFAVARVSRVGGGPVEAAVGGGFTLGSSPEVGTDVDVTGYAMGVGGEAIGCVARVMTRERGYPALRCAGLPDGTSGAPWLAGGAEVGITGGLDGGGCDENVSYAPPFDGAVKVLLARAEAGGPGDAAPTAFADDC